MRFILNILFLFPIIGFGQTQAFISGNDTICDNEDLNAEVLVSFSGVSPYTFVYAINGVNQPSITTTNNPYIILTPIPGIYVLQNYNDAISAGTVSGSALVTVLQSPTAIISLTNDSLSVLYPTANFTSQSIGNIISWDWHFGDNTSNDNSQNPIHTYPQWPPTVYQVYLIVIDDMGCQDTTSATVTVGHPTTSIQEHTTNKELLKITDLLGRETKQTNQPLFYIYDDGTVEKRIVIE